MNLEKVDGMGITMFDDDKPQLDSKINVPRIKLKGAENIPPPIPPDVVMGKPLKKEKF